MTSPASPDTSAAQAPTGSPALPYSMDPQDPNTVIRLMHEIKILTLEIQGMNARLARLESDRTQPVRNPLTTTGTDHTLTTTGADRAPIFGGISISAADVERLRRQQGQFYAGPAFGLANAAGLGLGAAVVAP